MGLLGALCKSRCFYPPNIVFFVKLPDYKRIYIMSDNQATVYIAMINKGSTKHPVAMEALRCLFWLSASYGFHLTGRYVSGTQNVAADSASRLLEPGQLDRLLDNLLIN